MRTLLSNHQMSLLHAISENVYETEDLRQFYQVSLWSLLARGYIQIRENVCELTASGEEVLQQFLKGAPRTRKQLAPLAASVEKLIRKRLHAVKKSARKAA